LNACLTREVAAKEAIYATDVAIAQMTDAAYDPQTVEFGAENLAVWIKRLSIEKAAAAQILREAVKCTEEARANVAAARTEVRVVELLLERRAEAKRLAEQKKEYAALDELGVQHYAIANQGM
jgi:flagellar biosynthesis chaperone FliJ